MRLLWFAFALIFLSACTDDKNLKKASEPKHFSDKTDILGYLNLIRKDLGLSPLLSDRSLDVSSQAHANYCAKNGVTGHNEIKDKPYFYATTPSKRVIKAGGKTSIASENITYKKYPDLYIDSLMSAIYHRFGFTNQEIDIIGFSTVSTDKMTASVFNMSNSKIKKLCEQKFNPSSGKFIINACENISLKIPKDKFDKAQKIDNVDIVHYPNNIPAQAYFSGENPDPMPECKILSTPVSIEFNRSLGSIKLLSFDIFKNGKKLQNTKLLSSKNDPNKRLNKYQFALFAQKPFEFDSKYEARVSYEQNGKKMQKNWYFTTQTPLKEYFAIDKNDELGVVADREYDIFFVPKNCNDLLNSYKYSGNAKVKINQIDANLLRIKLSGIKGQSINIKANDYSIKVVLTNSSQDSFNPNGIVPALLILASVTIMFFVLKGKK